MSRRGWNLRKGGAVSKADPDAIPPSSHHVRKAKVASGEALPAPPPTGGRVIPLRGPATLGDALGVLAPGAVATPLGDASSTAPLPGAGALPPAAPPLEQLPAENSSFCSLAGTLTANLAVIVCAASLRKSGIEPREPDEDDIEEAGESAASAYRRGLGDAPVPWWAGLCASFANLYIGMRVGGRKMSADEREASQAKAAAPPPPPPDGRFEPSSSNHVPSPVVPPAPTRTPRPAPLEIESQRKPS